MIKFPYIGWKILHYVKILALEHIYLNPFNLHFHLISNRDLSFIC